jgi:hypothetical protein
MGLRMPPVGDYAGGALYVISGEWVVSVSQYAGRDKDGYHWNPISNLDFFRPDVLRRQVQAAGLPMQVRFDGERCLFVPTNRRHSIGGDGLRIKRFLNRHYGTYGPQRRPVRWSWEVRQYD